MPGLKVFLSYHSSDKLLAGEIKLHLGNYGLNIFLAHEDIEPAQDWQSRIMLELKKADVFLPLLTDSFSMSKWTAQECGIAVARGIFIISLKVTIDPFGFLSKNQALSFKKENVVRSCSSIAKVISRNSRLQRRFLDGLVDSVRRSESFEEAIRRTSLLNDFSECNRKQVNEIVRAATGNPQIFKSFGARKRLETFFRNNHEKLDDSLMKAYRKKVV